MKSEERQIKQMLSLLHALCKSKVWASVSTGTRKGTGLLIWNSKLNADRTSMLPYFFVCSEQPCFISYTMDSAAYLTRDTLNVAH